MAGQTASNLTTPFSNNASSNGTWGAGFACPEVYDTKSAKIVKSLALSIIMLVALVGNSLVITVFAKTKSLQRTVNYYLVNLAVSDLIIPVLCIPKELVDVIAASDTWRVKGDVGLVLCKLHPFLIDISWVVSVLTLLWITVDRFCAVMIPLRVNLLPEKFRGIIILSTWIIAALIYSPYFYTLKLWQNSQGETKCILDWAPLDHVKATVTQVMFGVVLFGILPWILVVTLYSLVVVGIKRSRNRVNTEGSLTAQDRSFRVLKQALVITAVFALCYFPICAFYIVVVFVLRFTCSPLPYWGHLLFASKILVFSNAALNPCICLFFNENYRKGLRNVLRIRTAVRVHPIEMGRVRGDTIETR